MRVLPLVLLAACAAGPSHVRDRDGRPLPTSARLDADLAPARVRCGGRDYMIVESPPPYLLGNHVATTEVHVRDAAVLCTKILAN